MMLTRDGDGSGIEVDDPQSRHRMLALGAALVLCPTFVTQDILTPSMTVVAELPRPGATPALDVAAVEERAGMVEASRDSGRVCIIQEDGTKF